MSALHDDHSERWHDSYPYEVAIEHLADGRWRDIEAVRRIVANSIIPSAGYREAASQWELGGQQGLDPEDLLPVSVRGVSTDDSNRGCIIVAKQVLTDPCFEVDPAKGRVRLVASAR